ncbi:MAG: histone deacetylase, partial [Pseudomonadota bacterium]
RIFAAEPEVFCFSLHAANNYPAEKAVSDLDIALPDGTGDEAYLAALAGGLDRVLARPRPAIAFYNAGVDVWGGDRLGRLGLSLEGIRARDRMVIGRVRALGIPLVCVIGGGYDNDPERLAERHAIVFEEAAAALAS